MRTEKDMENPMENTTDEEMSAKDTRAYDIACGISIALGIAAFAVAWIVGSCIRKLGGCDLLLFGTTVGGAGLYLAGIAFLFVFILCVAGKEKTYKDILWIMIWMNQVFGMVMLFCPDVVQRVV